MFSLTFPNPLSKIQLGPHLVPDCVCLQELHSCSDQLCFVSLRGIVQRRVAQSGLGIKAVETAVIQGLEKQQLPWYSVKKKQRDLWQMNNQGVQIKGVQGHSMAHVIRMFSNLSEFLEAAH